jgi:hypothetical protein
MKVYSERRGIAPFILNLSAGRMWNFNFENRPHYLRERTAISTSYENPWAPQSVWVFWRKEISFASAGFRTPDRPVLGLVAISNKYIQPKKVEFFSLFPPLFVISLHDGYKLTCDSSSCQLHLRSFVWFNNNAKRSLV